MNFRPITAVLLSAASAASINGAELYVSPDGANVPPFNNWPDAATNIQNAVDAASAGDTVWVTNGTYASGGRAVYTTMTNRVVLDKPLTLQSVNGPESTLLVGCWAAGVTNGPGAVRCAWLTNGAVLSGFTLTNGATLATGDNYLERSGGGLWCSAPDAVVTNCVLTGNSASYGGGGAYRGTCITCTLAGNSAGYGGGAYSNTLNNCTLTANTATNEGGGAYSSSLNNCILTGNWASDYGGGACAGTLSNCTLTGNSGGEGGGACFGTLNNCTLAANSAGFGGGANSGTLNNCTLIANTANDSGGGAYSSTLNNCILTRNSASYYGGGARYGSLTNCTLTGNSAYSGGGAYSSTLSGCGLSTNTATDTGGGAYAGTLTACTLTANTATNSGGGACVATLNNCVLTRNSANVGGGACSNTLNSCTLSANTATDAGGASYATLTNCAILGNSAYVGGGAYASTITSTLLATNSADWGGGASLGTLVCCTLAGNGAYSGGGADSGTLITCLLVTNSAYLDGGGADLSTLLSCTLAGNSAGRYGGGASSSTVSNSIVFFNSAPQGPNFFPGNANRSIGYSCVTPLPTNGVGNIAYDPLFVSPAAGNFRLQSNSPCINFGNNSSYSSRETTDLDGRPRVVGYVVDIGAYEFDPRVDPSFIAWLQWYGLPTNGSADYTDPDGDGLNNWQEWVAGTNPTNAYPAPKMLAAEPSGTNVIVTWQSVTGAVYSLEYATNLALRPAFQLLAANLPGYPGTTTFIHTNAAAATAVFYRVRSP